MNAVQRFAVRLAARIAPPLARVLQTAGPTVERLEGQNLLLNTREADRRELLMREREDLREAIALSQGGWMARDGVGTFEVRETDSTATKQLKESLADLELALEDRGWKRDLAMAEMEFSRYGIQQIILISRLYRIKNPLIQRGVLISSYYVFGRGFEVSSTNKQANDVLQAFFANPSNICEVGQNALVKKEEAVQTDGNLFWAFFTDPTSGETTIRTIDPIEIERVISDPDDRAKPRYYHRRWTEKQFDEKTGVELYVSRDAYYVALGYEPDAIPQKIAGKPVMRGADGMPIPVYMCKEGNIAKWDFGCPPVYAAIDWARAYRHLMEDWCTIQRSLARFSWQVQTEGGAPAIANFKTALATTLANNAVSPEQNPPPVVGSAWIGSPKDKITPFKTSNATTSPEEGRRVLLMVAAAFGLPETFFGDASTGSLATAQSLDRPTELKFLHAQERWREWLQVICAEVLRRAKMAPGGKLREADTEAEPVTIDIKFPSILEHDITSRIAAITEAMTLNGFEATGIDERTGIGLLLEELGVEDVEAVLEAMYPRAEYDKIEDRTELLQASRELALNPPEPTQPGAEGPDGAPPNAPKPRKPHPKRTNPPSKESIDRAVLELRTAYKKLQERAA